MQLSKLPNVNKVDGTLYGMSALTRLARIASDMSIRPQLIEQARNEGATWEEIAKAMRMSRAGAIKYYRTAQSADRDLR